MKKQFLNLGKALNKAEQKQIFGGWDEVEDDDEGGGGGGGGHTHGDNGWCTNECCDNSECGTGKSCLSTYCGGYPNWKYCG